MLFQIYGETAGFQLLGWLKLCVRLIPANEFAHRTKWGGIACFLVLPAGLTIYFISIYVGAAMGAQWALNNPTYVYMNSWFHYFKLYAATLGCIGFMMLKYKWSIGKTDWFKVFPFLIVAANILIAVVSDFESGIKGALSPDGWWLSSENVWLYGGWWNWLNGAAGIINIFCMTGWWGIYASKDKKDMGYCIRGNFNHGSIYADRRAGQRHFVELSVAVPAGGHRHLLYYQAALCSVEQFCRWCASLVQRFQPARQGS